MSAGDRASRRRLRRAISARLGVFAVLLALALSIGAGLRDLLRGETPARRHSTASRPVSSATSPNSDGREARTSIAVEEGAGAIRRTVIRGKVVNERGNCVAGARVCLRAVRRERAGSDASAMREERRESRTDERGRFRIALDAETGDWVEASLEADAPLHEADQVDIDVGTLSSDFDTTLRLRRQLKRATITGCVRSAATGAALAEALVYAKSDAGDEEPPYLSATATDAAGCFSLDVVWHAELTVTAFTRGFFAHSFVVESEPATPHVVFLKPDTSRLRTVVFVPARSDAIEAGLIVTHLAAPPSQRDAIRAVERSPVSRDYEWTWDAFHTMRDTARSPRLRARMGDAAGGYFSPQIASAVLGVAEGEHRFLVSDGASRCALVDLLVSASDPAWIVREVRLTDGMRVDGVVHSATPLNRGEAVVRLLELPGREFPVEPGGRFSLVGIPPGKWTASVTRAGCLAEEHSIIVPPDDADGVVTVGVTLVNDASVTIRVVDTNDRAVSGVRLHHYGRFLTSTNSDGFATIGGLPSGVPVPLLVYSGESEGQEVRVVGWRGAAAEITVRVPR